MTEAYVALRVPSVEQLGAALGVLQELPASELASVTAAAALAGGEGEEAGALACVHTTLMPAELVELARESFAEELGDTSVGFELLLFGEDEWVAGGAVVPHPALLETGWWMESLTGAWPEARLPDGSKPPLTAVRASTRALRSLGPVPGFESVTILTEADARAVTDAATDESTDAATAEADPSCANDSCSSCGPKKIAEFCGPVTDEPDEWVVVATASSPDLSPFTEEAIELSFLETMLRHAGIETAWYPHRPGDMYSRPQIEGSELAQLLVQPWRIDEARALLAEAANVEPDGEWWAEDWDEDAQATRTSDESGTGERA